MFSEILSINLHLYLHIHLLNLYLQKHLYYQLYPKYAVNILGTVCLASNTRPVHYGWPFMA